YLRNVSNLKKCLADASMHVPLDEIKVDKILRLVEEPIEIMDREIRKFKRRKIALVKVRWNSKCGPGFTWEHEDQMRIKDLNLEEAMIMQTSAFLFACLDLDLGFFAGIVGVVYDVQCGICASYVNSDEIGILDRKFSLKRLASFSIDAFRFALLDRYFGYDLYYFLWPLDSIIVWLYYSIIRNLWSSLIPLSHGSFDVTVGMDWLSKRKFVIVSHEKVVRIPLKGDEILRVHGERTQGVSKEEHEVHLKLVLDSLRKEKLYAKFSKLGDALSRKERVKSRRVRGMILVAQSEAFKQENILAERLHGLDPQMERKGDENNSKEWNSGDDQLRLRWMIYLVVLADAAERVRDAIGFEYCLASSSGWTNIRNALCAPVEALYGRKCRSPVLWAEIGESSLTGLELVQETTDKVVLVKEKPKAARDRQKSYVDYRRKPLEFEVGDRVLLRVSPWKGVVRFGKKGKLAPRYVGPFEILERIGLVAYRLRLPEELNSVHDTFHVSNLKKCLADANLHVPLDEIKVDKTLHFVEEPVEIMDREIKKLKHRKVALVVEC
ncbi:hypothetical protein Tco_0934688, partial [Tanacetum coccineum]